MRAIVAVVLKPGNNLGQHNLAAIALYEIGTDDGFDGIVRAFDKHVGFDFVEQPFRCIFLEDNHQVDGLQRREHRSAGFFGLGGPAFTLQPFDRGIRIQANHQPVAGSRAPEIIVRHAQGAADRNNHW